MKGFFLLIVQVVSITMFAAAQDASSVAVEGHAFDAKTLKPLQYVLVEFDIQLSSGPGYGTSAPTDGNGFYSLQVPVPNEPANIVRFDATCATRKDNVQVLGQIYNPLRAEIYRRDFYVSLPRGITKCAPQ